jgi:tripartite-type tricarboxylate transporter receptor subunit TctC
MAPPNRQRRLALGHLVKTAGAVTAAAAAVALGARPGWVRAASASFPQRTVRWVVPYAVGIGPDVVARSVAEQLQQRWQQPVLVDNKPGASGIVAFSELRQTAPDGHTLFLADTATLCVNPLLHARLPYDPDRDLLPLSLLFQATFLLWTGGGSRWPTLAALAEAARHTPGRISYATLGNGHASHVAIESYAQAAGLHMLHVPFKDAGALMTAVASGEVDLTAFSMNTLAGLMARGKLRPLAVAAARRLAGHPGIPTLLEAGGPPLTLHPWAAVVVAAGTPPAALAALQRDLHSALAAPEVRERAAQAGFDITPSTPQAVRERMAADVARLAPLVAEGRISRW